MPRAVKSGEMDEVRSLRAGWKEKEDMPVGKNTTIIVKSRKDVHVSTNFPTLRIAGMCKTPRFSERNFNWGATNSRSSRYGAIEAEATSIVDNCGGLRRVYFWEGGAVKLRPCLLRT